MNNKYRIAKVTDYNNDVFYCIEVRKTFLWVFHYWSKIKKETDSGLLIPKYYYTYEKASKELSSIMFQNKRLKEKTKSIV